MFERLNAIVQGLLDDAREAVAASVAPVKVLSAHEVLAWEGRRKSAGGEDDGAYFSLHVRASLTSVCSRGCGCEGRARGDGYARSDAESAMIAIVFLLPPWCRFPIVMQTLIIPQLSHSLTSCLHSLSLSLA